MPERRRFFLSEGNGRDTTVRFFEIIGRNFKKYGRVADYVVCRGPHTQIRLISEEGLMLDVERFMNATISVTIVNPLAKESEFILKQSPIKPLALVKLLKEQLPLSKKTV